MRATLDAVPVVREVNPVWTPYRHIGAALALALLLSLLAHLGTALLFVQFGGRPLAGGENGHEGAGDVTMDITVQGPRAERAQPVIAAVQPTAPPTPPTLDVPHVDTPPRTPRDSATERDPSPTAFVQESVQRGEASPSALALGNDSPTTSGGRAAGAAAVRNLILGSAGFMPTSIEGQRALLPAATTCDDLVAGVWRALKYSSQFGGQWVRFTLLIHRDAGDDLTGSIRSRIWSGTPTDRTPPPCTYGQSDTTHAMVAHGHVTGEQLTFGSHTHRLVADHCPQLFASSVGYAPDNFSGNIDSMRQEFQSVNNDGAYDINTPYVFRRVGCLEARETVDGEDDE